MCVASAADHCQSGEKSVAPDDLGIINIDNPDEGVLIVGPGDPVTIFNPLEAGHRESRYDAILKGAASFRNDEATISRNAGAACLGISSPAKITQNCGSELPAYRVS